jgi:hypothetical protein
LPHRAVVREEKESTKVRPVFDASSKSTGPSLNDCLYAGPNLLCKIFDILLRFRTNKIALISDIKQAFLNIGVHADHTDFLRFLWFDQKDSHDIIAYRFLRVVFGVTSSPFLLQGTIRHHCQKMVENGFISADFVEDFLKNLYVDDSLNGGDTVISAFEFYKKAKWLTDAAGLSLRKWCSNSDELQKRIDQCEGVVQKTSAVGIKCEDELSFSNFQLGAARDDVTVKSVHIFAYSHVPPAVLST